MGFSLTLIGISNLEFRVYAGSELVKNIVFPFHYQWDLYGTAVAVISAFGDDLCRRLLVIWHHRNTANYRNLLSWPCHITLIMQNPLRHTIVTQPCLLSRQRWISCDHSFTLYQCLLESLCWAGTRNLWLNLGPEIQETLIIQVNYIYTRSHATDDFCTQVSRDPRFLILVFCVTAV